MATVFRLPAQKGMVNPVAQLGAGSVSDPRRVPSRHLPQTTKRGIIPGWNADEDTAPPALIGFFALESACLAQGSKPKSAPGPGPTTTAVDPTKYLNRDWENVYNQGRTGDHLRGNVTLAEGALPWDAIPVVVMCDGKAKFTTTTDYTAICDCARPAGRFYNNHRYGEVAGRSAVPSRPCCPVLIPPS
jgi:hypothetical protein